MKIIKTLPSMHPGEMLRDEFLAPLGLTPYAVAKACGVPRTRIERIVREKLGISASFDDVRSPRDGAARGTSPRRGEVGSRLRDPGEGDQLYE